MNALLEWLPYLALLMRPLFKFANPIKLDKKTRVAEIRGSAVYVHWTVFMVAAIILAGVLRRPVFTLDWSCRVLGGALNPRNGHLIAALWLGCPVYSIELYPIFGVTRFGAPWSRLHYCLIAWAGAVAQAVIALPIILWVLLFGYTRFEIVNMLLVILGFFSGGVAILNLFPVPPLDGATAWGIFPAVFAQRRAQSRNERK